MSTPSRRTPLQAAAEEGHKDVVKALLNKIKNGNVVVFYPIDDYSSILEHPWAVVKPGSNLDKLTTAFSEYFRYRLSIPFRKESENHYSLMGDHLPHTLLPGVLSRQEVVQLLLVNPRFKVVEGTSFVEPSEPSPPKRPPQSTRQPTSKGLIVDSTPLHTAAEEGHKDVVKALLNKIKNGNVIVFYPIDDYSSILEHPWAVVKPGSSLDKLTTAFSEYFRYRLSIPFRKESENHYSLMGDHLPHTLLPGVLSRQEVAQLLLANPRFKVVEGTSFVEPSEPSEPTPPKRPPQKRPPQKRPPQKRPTSKGLIGDSTPLHTAANEGYEGVVETLLDLVENNKVIEFYPIDDHSTFILEHPWAVVEPGSNLDKITAAFSEYFRHHPSIAFRKQSENNYNLIGEGVALPSGFQLPGILSREEVAQLLIVNPRFGVVNETSFVEPSEPSPPKRPPAKQPPKRPTSEATNIYRRFYTTTYCC